MSILLQMQQAAEAAAASAVDMNVAQKGGGGILYPAGYCFARLVEVLELGNHVTSFQGVAKDPAPQIRLGFAIFGEGYQGEDGKPGYIRTYDLTMSANEKAKTFKLFKKLNYKGQAKTFAQLLGQTYLLKVNHHTSKAAGAKPRSVIDLEGFLPPNDPVTKQPYPIPDAPDNMYRLFLWDMPTQKMWDSLHMEGVFDDGNSKNIIQDQIMQATNFPGSAIEQLLGGSTDMPSLAVEAVPAVPAAPLTTPDMPFEGGVPTTLGVPPVAVVAEVNAKQVPVEVPVDIPAELPEPVVVDVPVPNAPVAAPAIPTAPAVHVAPPVAPAMPTVPSIPAAPVVA